MEKQIIPKQGEIYRHFKGGLYQIITLAIHSETGEVMVVYQALFGEFKAYVRPLAMFAGEVERDRYSEISQKYRFELVRNQAGETVADKFDGQKVKEADETKAAKETGETKKLKEIKDDPGTGVIMQEVAGHAEQLPDYSLQNTVNPVLLNFLDAKSYSKKLEVLTSNIKHLNDRLINDMAVALDCAVEEGPLETRIQALIQCLQAMRRFEDRRLR